MRLTLYMLDETVTDFEQALRPPKAGGDDAFEEIPLRAGLPFEARAYLQAEHATKPKWMASVEKYLELDDPDRLRNVSNSLLIVLKAAGRFFAVSYGYGFMGLERKRIEQGFGLRTTLNGLDPAKIKSLDVRNIDLVTRQRRTSVNYDSGLEDFEINFDQDIVQVAAGQPRQDVPGTKLQGADALSWTGDASFTELGETCTRLHAVWSKKTYEQAFPFFDHLREVRDDELVKALDENLAEAIARRQTDRLTLAYPEMSNWDRAEGFKIYQGHRRTVSDEIELTAVYAFCDQLASTDVDPRKVHILALDGDDQPVGPAQTLYEYAVFETQLKSKTYILTLSKWYTVAPSYLAEVNDGVGRIATPCGLTLPPIWNGEKEGHYNERCAKADPSLLLLDKKLVHVEGHSRVEACDLLSSAGHFVNVKRQTQSATLSHLFAQGSVSLQLLHQHPKYRAALLKQLPATGWSLPFTEDAIADRKAITCVYAVSSKSGKDLCSVLPFFSKVNLRNHKAFIENMGYNVAACVIPIVPKP
jgi:uncharacterized protein (TIGR04141 family)